MTGLGGHSGHLLGPHGHHQDGCRAVGQGALYTILWAAVVWGGTVHHTVGSCHVGWHCTPYCGQLSCGVALYTILWAAVVWGGTVHHTVGSCRVGWHCTPYCGQLSCGVALYPILWAAVMWGGTVHHAVGSCRVGWRAVTYLALCGSWIVLDVH